MQPRRIHILQDTCVPRRYSESTGKKTDSNVGVTEKAPYAFFFSFRDQHDDPPLPFSAGPPHALDEPDRTFVRVKADDQVDVADVETLLTDACGHQGVVSATAKLADDLGSKRRG